MTVADKISESETVCEKLSVTSDEKKMAEYVWPVGLSEAEININTRSGVCAGELRLPC